MLRCYFAVVAIACPRPDTHDRLERVKRVRSSGSLPRHRLENGEARGHKHPIRLVARKECNRRMKERWLIERARVDRMLAVSAGDTSEYQASAGCAMIPHGVPAAYGLRDGMFRLTTEAHRTRREDEKWDETGPRSFAAISAEAITLVLGVARRFIPNRPAEAPADVDRYVAHVPRLARYGGGDHSLRNTGFPRADTGHLQRRVDL